MHVRIGLERQARRHTILESAGGALRVPEDEFQQLASLSLAPGAPIAERGAQIQREQTECLVVRDDAVVGDRYIRVDERAKQSIRTMEPGVPEIDAMLNEPGGIASTAEALNRRGI